MAHQGDDQRWCRDDCPVTNIWIWRESLQLEIGKCDKINLPNIVLFCCWWNPVDSNVSFFLILCRKRVGDSITLQGNLDPCALFQGKVCHVLCHHKVHPSPSAQFALVSCQMTNAKQTEGLDFSMTNYQLEIRRKQLLRPQNRHLKKRVWEIERQAKPKPYLLINAICSSSSSSSPFFFQCFPLCLSSKAGMVDDLLFGVAALKRGGCFLISCLLRTCEKRGLRWMSDIVTVFRWWCAHALCFNKQCWS